MLRQCTLRGKGTVAVTVYMYSIWITDLDELMYQMQQIRFNLVSILHCLYCCSHCKTCNAFMISILHIAAESFLRCNSKVQCSLRCSSLLRSGLFWDVTQRWGSVVWRPPKKRTAAKETSVAAERVTKSRPGPIPAVLTVYVACYKIWSSLAVQMILWYCSVY